MAERFTATKLDTNKPPMDLIPWEAMAGAAQVLDFGRQKYAPHNWRKGFHWTRLASAALRHIFAWLSGEDKDPESGLSHIDHALCCLMFLSAHLKSGLGKDDRAHVLLASEESEVTKPTKRPETKCKVWQVHFTLDMDNGKPSERSQRGPEGVPYDFPTRKEAEAYYRERAEAGCTDILLEVEK